VRRERRGRPSPGRGRGWVRRSTATSCRSTSNSAFLEAGERPSSTSQPQSRMKIRQSRRRDMADHPGLLLALVHRCSSQARQTSGTPHGRRSAGGALRQRSEESPPLSVNDLTKTVIADVYGQFMALLHGVRTMTLDFSARAGFEIEMDDGRCTVDGRFPRRAVRQVAPGRPGAGTRGKATAARSCRPQDPKRAAARRSDPSSLRN
jgi:hypothetical protein